MGKKTKWFAIALLMIAVAGCGLLPDWITEGVSAMEESKLAGQYEPSEEYYIGRGVSAVIVGEFEPVEAVDKQSTDQIVYLNEMAGFIHEASSKVTRSGIKLGDHTGRGYDAQQRVNNMILFKGLHVGLLKSDDVAAFATPGGFIWLTMGAVEMCDTEDELAAIIAHELGHIILNHGMDNYRDMRQGEIWSSYASENLFPGDGLGATFGNLVVTYAEEATKYNPDQEFEADNWGTRALAAVGYDPKAMERLLLKVQAYEKANPQGSGEYLESHPSVSERLSFVRVLLNDADLKQRGDTMTPDALVARQQRFVAAFKD